MPGTMTIWFVAAIPALIMLFALAMERLEHRLRHLAAQENLVQENLAAGGNEREEFVPTARPDDVRALAGSGIPGSRELFRLRRLRRTAMVHSRRVGQRS
jgi:hypothetical protein